MTVASVAKITKRIIERSKPSREAYLEQLAQAANDGPRRSSLTCGNLAHGFAACGPVDKSRLAEDVVPNLAIVTSYNDMLSAHEPFATFPDLIKQAARDAT